ncbi:membrane protein [Pragia fontium]|uniref:Membrane protein n=1 Tax=Pragia fontium TaxID=82985 RepID=A0ABQ5LKT7_9GAMM|nr:two-component system QseEF-associated lipoprotein QseG [Pragia fontium]GKX64004.1 membrane protein [Pragia fontium]
MPTRFTKKDKTIIELPDLVTVIKSAGILRKTLLLAALATPVMLAGCGHQGVSDSASGTMVYEAPINKVSDYSRVSCDGNIWKGQDDETNSNSLYWLRLIDCTRSLTLSQARIQSYSYEITKWDGVLKRAILLSRLDAAHSERRNALEQLKNYRAMYPANVYPLILLWNDEQTLELNLFDERARHQRLKESSDTQIEAMHNQLQETKHQLNETTRKLENLTDIERQLSSRKVSPGDGASHNSVAESGGEIKPAQVSSEQKVVPEAKKEKPVEQIKPTESEKPAASVATKKPVASEVSGAEKSQQSKPQVNDENSKPVAPSAGSAATKPDAQPAQK